MTQPMMRRFGEMVEIRSGYTARTGIRPKSGGSHWVLQIRDFSRDRTAVDFTSLMRFSPAPRASARPLQDGDVVFLARGARNFAFAVSSLPTPTVAANCFFVLRAAEEVTPPYLAWFLNQPSTLRILSRSATSGAHMPVVRRGDLERLEVPVPPLAVQRMIVELDNLRRIEQALLRDLALKKQELVSTVCISAACGAIPTGAEQ